VLAATEPGAAPGAALGPWQGLITRAS